MDKAKVIWITGASSGIGEALVYYYNKLGINTIISSRREEELLKVRNNCLNKEKVKVLPLDLLQIHEFDLLTRKAWNKFGKIDLLINNAGVSQRSLIVETKIQVYEKLMNINYIGTIALTKTLLPYYIKNGGGQYAVVTSVMGKFGSPYRSGYCGAKHALHGFFDVLRMEHQKDGIEVSLICPGFVQTNVTINAFNGDGSRMKEDDKATQNGLDVNIFAKKMAVAIEKKKWETYIGGKETMGVFLKKFSSRLTQFVVNRSAVR